MNNQQIDNQILEHVDKWMSGIGQVIKELAKQLGIAAEHVYEVYTKQQFAEGIVGTLLSLVGIGTLIWFIKFVWRTTAKFNDDGNRAFVRTFGTGIPLIAIAIIGSAVLPISLLKVINPEYYTINDLLELVRSLAN
jgi:hypothetical protein